MDNKKSDQLETTQVNSLSANSRYTRPKSLNYANAALASKEQLVYSDRFRANKQKELINPTAARNNTLLSNSSGLTTTQTIAAAAAASSDTSRSPNLSKNESFDSKLCVIDKHSELEYKKTNSNFKDHLKQVKKARSKSQKTQNSLKKKNNEIKIEEEKEKEMDATAPNTSNRDGYEQKSSTSTSSSSEDDEADTKSLIYPAYVPIALK